MTNTVNFKAIKMLSWYLLQVGIIHFVWRVISLLFADAGIYNYKLVILRLPG